MQLLLLTLVAWLLLTQKLKPCTAQQLWRQYWALQPDFSETTLLLRTPHIHSWRHGGMTVVAQQTGATDYAIRWCGHGSCEQAVTKLRSEYVVHCGAIPLPQLWIIVCMQCTMYSAVSSWVLEQGMLAPAAGSHLPCTISPLIILTISVRKGDKHYGI